jgi:hypothetical protein
MTWRTLYNSCLAESDATELTILIHKTEHAMTLRRNELSQNCDAELLEINDALRVMLVLKATRLGWPHPDSSRKGSELHRTLSGGPTKGAVHS